MDRISVLNFGTLLLCLYLLQITEGNRLPEITITEAVARSSSEIELSWKPADRIRKGRLKYIVRYKAKGSVHSRAATDKTELVLNGLRPDTTYVFAIRATKGRAKGDWSKSTHVTTLVQELDDSNIDGNVTVGDVGTQTANVTWDLQNNIKTSDFNGFRVVWKNKDDKEEAETKGYNLTLPNLEPATRYSVSVYVLQNTGSKIKLGAVKFQTQDEPIKAPRKLRVKNVTDKKIVIKWSHLRPTTNDHVVTNYVIRYKRRGVDPPDVCELVTSNTTKIQALYGVLPDAKYSVRVAGRFDNVTGPFTEWLKVRTQPYNHNSSDVQVYHVSPEEVLLIWNPFLETIDSQIEVFTDLETLSLSLVKRFVVNGTSHVMLEDLLPDKRYRVLIKQEARKNCPLYKEVEFKTNFAKNGISDKYMATAGNGSDKINSDYLEYEPYLRILPLPRGNHLVTWSPILTSETNTSFLYIIRILGEPFMFHLATHYIPIGQTYHVIHDLDVQKTYSISLRVFESYQEDPVFVSKNLLVLPAKDIVKKDDVTDTSSQLDDIWPITSMDIVVDHNNTTHFKSFIQNDSLSVQRILDSDWFILSKLYPDETYTTNTENDTEKLLVFPLQEIPTVIEIDNISVQEGASVDITCVSRGDPYPIITWFNITANETMIEMMDQGSEDNQGYYLGSGIYTNYRTFMGAKKFFSIQQVELWHDGTYACAAENPTGSNMSVFAIKVFPKPPSPVTNLTTTSMTPFDISVQWRPPETGSDIITGYNVILADEYDVILRTVNVTSLKTKFLNVDPNTLYKVYVSGFHTYANGAKEVSAIKSNRIPSLGPPLDVKVTTVNSTTLQVSWSPPEVVHVHHVKLRTYLFYHRKAGTRKAEEIQIGRNFTAISIIDLMPEENYEIQIVAMSEDGQVSYSDWLNGTTNREAYMDETRPPPPPRDVFLRPEAENVIVTWYPPKPDENILVRGYFIEVLHNGTKREAMEVDYKESSVIVYEVEMGVLYHISVKAQNKAGKSLDKWAEIYIPEEYVTQDPVQSFHGKALSSTTLELLWEPPEGGTFTHFVLSYVITGVEEPVLPGGGHLPSSTRNFIVRSLRPYTFYEFTIVPFLKRMKGQPVNTTVMTYSDKPANAPENVTLSPINSTTILVTCSPPDVDKNGKIITYKLSYRTKRTWRNDNIVMAEDDETLKTYVTELLPSTVYEFRVRAMTVNGSGPWSLWHQTRTLAPAPILPKVPQELKAQALATSIELTWQPPEQDVSHITGYIVGYGRFIPEVYRYSTTKDELTYTLDNLEAGSVYIVSVRSFNDHGESVAAFELVHTTDAI